MPFEPVVRSRQMRPRIRNKMAVLMLSMMQAVAGTWVGRWVGGEWEKAVLGREWDPFTPHLLLELASPRPQKWEQMERKKEVESWRDWEKARGWGKRWKERGREGEREKRA